MKEIRIHGRGGQGSLVLAQFMAIAALWDGKYGQAFPYLGGGGERRGKPIVAFFRLSDNPIRVRSRISTPDYVIVQDPTIVGEIDIEEGLKPKGMVLINTEKDIGALKLKTPNVFAISAEQLARRILGRPIINTALLGTFASVSGEISLLASIQAVQSKFPGVLGVKNARVVEESYRSFQKGVA